MSRHVIVGRDVPDEWTAGASRDLDVIVNRGKTLARNAGKTSGVVIVRTDVRGKRPRRVHNVNMVGAYAPGPTQYDDLPGYARIEFKT